MLSLVCPGEESEEKEGVEKEWSCIDMYDNDVGKKSAINFEVKGALTSATLYFTS